MDYTQMDHEELGAAAGPLNRIVNRDVKILGYMPTDDEVDAARAELDQLNQAARDLNQTSPHRVAGIGGLETQGMDAEGVIAAIEQQLQERARDG
jgi:hypothetical protein